MTMFVVNKNHSDICVGEIFDERGRHFKHFFAWSTLNPFKNSVKDGIE